MLRAELDSVLRAARQARASAYAPYSHFAVGAAVLCDDGEIVAGSNIENASYGLSMCAERVALFAALARGKRGITVLCVAGSDERLTMPCGACRQVMNEFNAHMLVVCASSRELYSIGLSELLPKAFSTDDLA